MSVVHCYPVVGKQKAIDVCAAFAQGCGGALVLNNKIHPGPAMFYGVNESNRHIWDQVQKDGREFYYADNSFFDETRQKYFRVAKNAVQIYGVGQSNGRRFDSLGIEIKPWTAGNHMLIVQQSHHFMSMIAGYDGEWTINVLNELRNWTKRKLVVRGWTPDKKALASTLDSDLEEAHCLVTWSSAAAVNALIRGVPVITQGPSAASTMSGSMDIIEDLPRPERRNWAGVLADNQWTLAEMTDGLAWRALG